MSILQLLTSRTGGLSAITLIAYTPNEIPSTLQSEVESLVLEFGSTYEIPSELGGGDVGPLVLEFGSTYEIPSELGGDVESLVLEFGSTYEIPSTLGA